jgi:hypothetical protein
LRSFAQLASVLRAHTSLDPPLYVRIVIGAQYDFEATITFEAGERFLWLSDCLLWGWVLDAQRNYSYLHRLLHEVTVEGCDFYDPARPTGYGSMLLGFVDQLNMAVKVMYCILSDAATRTFCGALPTYDDAHFEFDLGVLRQLVEGKTWYNTHFYLPRMDDVHDPDDEKKIHPPANMATQEMLVATLDAFNDRYKAAQIALLQPVQVLQQTLAQVVRARQAEYDQTHEQGLNEAVEANQQANRVVERMNAVSGPRLAGAPFTMKVVLQGSPEWIDATTVFIGGLGQRAGVGVTVVGRGVLDVSLTPTYRALQYLWVSLQRVVATMPKQAEYVLLITDSSGRHQLAQYGQDERMPGVFMRWDLPAESPFAQLREGGPQPTSYRAQKEKLSMAIRTQQLLDTAIRDITQARQNLLERLGSSKRRRQEESPQDVEERVALAQEEAKQDVEAITLRDLFKHVVAQLYKDNVPTCQLYDNLRSLGVIDFMQEIWNQHPQDLTRHIRYYRVAPDRPVRFEYVRERQSVVVPAGGPGAAAAQPPIEADISVLRVQVAAA